MSTLDKYRARKDELMRQKYGETRSAYREGKSYGRADVSVSNHNSTEAEESKKKVYDSIVPREDTSSKEDYEDDAAEFAAEYEAAKQMMKRKESDRRNREEEILNAYDNDEEEEGQCDYLQSPNIFLGKRSFSCSKLSVELGGDTFNYCMKGRKYCPYNN